MEFEDRNYLIFSTTEVDKVIFEEVLETSAETLRISNDGSKTFIKWDTTPSFLDSITTKEGPYSYAEIINILAGSDWSGNTEPVIGT